MSDRRIPLPAAILASLTLTHFAAMPATAEGGWYAGGSVGNAVLELDVGAGQTAIAYDEDDVAWKAFGGYTWDMPVIDLGVEGGYVNLGNPPASFSGIDVDLEAAGANLWGVAGFNIGPVGLFGKLGGIYWNLDGETSGAVESSFDESGFDIGYGVGAKFKLWSVEIRAEFESYDIEDTETVDMYSLGLAWRF